MKILNLWLWPFIPLLFLMSISEQSVAQQPDAEYLVRQKQYGEQWTIEDQQVRTKLAALEKLGWPNF